MAFRSREMMKKIVKKIGGEQNLAPGVKEQLRKSVPDRKIVMGRANRGIFAGRHIQFGNRVSEDGGNKSVCLFCYLFASFRFFLSSSSFPCKLWCFCSIMLICDSFCHIGFDGNGLEVGIIVDLIELFVLGT